MQIKYWRKYWIINFLYENYLRTSSRPLLIIIFLIALISIVIAWVIIVSIQFFTLQSAYEKSQKERENLHLLPHSVQNPKLLMNPQLTSDSCLDNENQCWKFFDNQNTATVTLKKAELVEVLHRLSQYLKINLLLSSHIKGSVTARFNHAKITAIFASVLQANGLAKELHGNILYIAPKTEFLKHHQFEKHWEQLKLNKQPLQTRLWQINYAQAAQLLRVIQNNKANLLSKRGQASVDNRTNTLTIFDIPQQLIKISKIIQQLDVPVNQLAINARLVMVDNDSKQELGIKWDDLTSFNPTSTLKQAAQDYTPTGLPFRLSHLTLPTLNNLNFRLRALETAGHAELISNPYLFTADQQTASIEAGEEIPYQELTERGGTAVVFKKAVLGLKVTPHVLPGKKVMLQLTINQDRPSVKTVLGVPTITTHQINTQVQVKDGETIVLGGIYEQAQSENRENIPYINHIPVVGWVFKQLNARDNKRELFIFVTPRIIT